MTSAIAFRPMTDPFAPNPTGRFSTPPFVPTQATQNAPVTGLFAQSRSTSQAMPSQRAMSMAPTALRGPAEFGVFAAGPPAQSNTSATRVRASQPPNLTSGLPVVSASNEPSVPSQRQRNRQSHNPAAVLNSSPPRPEYLSEEYVLHPCVWEYKQAHPQRPMVAFGPYILLQTLGEGEFGKVKMGVHHERGYQAAVKLIRRGSLEDEARANKVEREISVLKTLKHPHIVRMLDVIDTEKYIGIVLEYAGGGELFDHILANKYLKERDASKLFAQLVSGVDYLHQKHVVHRDLKLENLLLDKNRNIIITDFGFANRFDREHDDLMATSCGSPCYAAPELVISEGLYVGSAVDIWSCGVILYAMLSGYLPFDDDPDNPDGDNINLLYKYIISTKLRFPDQISDSAKDLLELMLVPNPEDRCRIEDIMAHPWLAAHRNLFGRSVEEHEFICHDKVAKKFARDTMEMEERRAIQRELLRARYSIARSQSSTTGMLAASGGASHRPSTRPHTALPVATTMPEYLNNAGRAPARQAINLPPPVPVAAQTSPVLADAIVMSPTAASLPPAPASAVQTMLNPLTSEPAAQPTSGRSGPIHEDESGSPVRPPNANRHTIQVEYDEEASYSKESERYEEETPPSENLSTPRSGLLYLAAPTSDMENESVSSEQDLSRDDISDMAVSVSEASHGLAVQETSETPNQRVLTSGPTTPVRKGKKLDEVASPSTPRGRQPEQELATPRAISHPVRPRHDETPRGTRPANEKITAKTPLAPQANKADIASIGLPNIPAVRRERNRKGMSLDRFGLGRLLGSVQGPSAGAASSSANPPQRPAQRTRLSLRPAAGEDDAKSKRRTLQPMVNRSNSVRGSKISVAHPDPAVPLGDRDINAAIPIAAPTAVSNPGKATISTPVVTQPTHAQSSVSVASADQLSSQLPSDRPQASSSAAKKVMDWFRRKSVVNAPVSKGGFKSDSTSSFVQVSDIRNPALRKEEAIQAAPAGLPVPPRQEGKSEPEIAVATLTELIEAKGDVPVQEGAPASDRMPLGPAGSKTNIAPASASSPELLKSSDSRPKSIAPDAIVPIAQPLSGTTAPSSRTQLRQASSRPDEESTIRIYTGLVDQSALSSKPPKVVMAEVLSVLHEMGVIVKKENEYRLRCTRARKRKGGVNVGLGLSNVVTGGSLSQSPPTGGLLSGGGLKGMLLRRGSSRSSTHPAALARSNSDSLSSQASPVVLPTPQRSPQIVEPVYGEHSQDNGDEVKFTVELCRMKNLPGLYLLSIKRSRGGIWSFKFIYQTILEYVYIYYQNLT